MEPPVGWMPSGRGGHGDLTRPEKKTCARSPALEQVGGARHGHIRDHSAISADDQILRTRTGAAAGSPPRSLPACAWRGLGPDRGRAKAAVSRTCFRGEGVRPRADPLRPPGGATQPKGRGPSARRTKPIPGGPSSPSCSLAFVACGRQHCGCEGRAGSVDARIALLPSSSLGSAARSFDRCPLFRRAPRRSKAAFRRCRSAGPRILGRILLRTGGQMRTGGPALLQRSAPAPQRPPRTLKRQGRGFAAQAMIPTGGPAGRSEGAARTPAARSAAVEARESSRAALEQQPRRGSATARHESPHRRARAIGCKTRPVLDGRHETKMPRSNAWQAADLAGSVRSGRRAAAPAPPDRSGRAAETKGKRLQKEPRRRKSGTPGDGLSDGVPERLKRRSRLLGCATALRRCRCRLLCSRLSGRLLARRSAFRRAGYPRLLGGRVVVAVMVVWSRLRLRSLRSPAKPSPSRSRGRTSQGWDRGSTRRNFDLAWPRGAGHGLTDAGRRQEPRVRRSPSDRRTAVGGLAVMTGTRVLPVAGLPPLTRTHGSGRAVDRGSVKPKTAGPPPGDRFHPPLTHVSTELRRISSRCQGLNFDGKKARTGSCWFRAERMEANDFFDPGGQGGTGAAFGLAPHFGILLCRSDRRTTGSWVNRHADSEYHPAAGGGRKRFRPSCGKQGAGGRFFHGRRTTGTRGRERVCACSPGHRAPFVLPEG